MDAIDETKEERRRRLKREANARYRATPRGDQAHKRGMARFKEKPENRLRLSQAAARWDTENPARKLLNQCRKRSEDRGQECTLTLEEVEALVAPMVCSVTGVPLSREPEGAGRVIARRRSVFHLAGFPAPDSL